MRLIEALAKAFGVEPAFFGDYDERQLGLLHDQVELLALVRDAGITSKHLVHHRPQVVRRQGAAGTKRLSERSASGR